MEAGPSAGAIVSNSPNHVQLSDGNVSHAVSAAAAVKKGVADHDAYAKMMARLPIALQSEARFDCFLKVSVCLCVCPLVVCLLACLPACLFTCPHLLRSLNVWMKAHMQCNRQLVISLCCIMVNMAC